jgi:hypothetical protein
MSGGRRRQVPAALPPKKRSGSLFTGGWVSPRVVLDGCGKFRPHGDSTSNRPLRSESLYRLRYPGPINSSTEIYKQIIAYLIHAVGCFLSSYRGCAMVFVFNHLPTKAKTWVQSQASPCYICGGQSGTVRGFFHCTFVFPRRYYSTTNPHSFTHLSSAIYRLKLSD